MLKLVIFDMDGLMLDTEQLYFRAFSEACAARGLDPPMEAYLRTVGAACDIERRIYREAFPALDADAFYDEIQDRCAALMRAGCYAVKPGLFELFDAIDRRGGLRTAVVTANDEAVALPLLTATGILPRLDGAVFREMVAHAKPAPDAHLLCCRQLGVMPEEALVLEDSEVGLRAALAAGIPVIAVPDVLEPSDEVLARCLARCGCLRDVIPFLAR